MNDTSWKLYTTNTETLDAIISACETAEKTIDLEIFIFTSDDFSKRLIEICSKKASEGVKIRFLWDDVGSFNLFSSDIINDLKDKGIELVFFKTIFPSFFESINYKSWYFRNHLSFSRGQKL